MYSPDALPVAPARRTLRTSNGLAPNRFIRPPRRHSFEVSKTGPLVFLPARRGLRGVRRCFEDESVSAALCSSSTPASYRDSCSLRTPIFDLFSSLAVHAFESGDRKLPPRQTTNGERRPLVTTSMSFRDWSAIHPECSRTSARGPSTASRPPRHTRAGRSESRSPKAPNEGTEPAGHPVQERRHALHVPGHHDATVVSNRLTVTCIPASSAFCIRR